MPPPGARAGGCGPSRQPSQRLEPQPVLVCKPLENANLYASLLPGATGNPQEFRCNATEQETFPRKLRLIYLIRNRVRGVCGDGALVRFRSPTAYPIRNQ